MGTRYFALVLGVIYIVIAIAGFVPPLLSPISGAPTLSINLLTGNLLGLFPVNLVHTLVHLIIGIWGVLVFRSYEASHAYAKTVGVLFLLLAIMGLVPGLNTLFGLAPLFSGDVVLHALTAVAGLYFGYFVHSEEATIAGTHL